MILKKSAQTYLFWGLFLIFIFFNFYCLGIQSQYLFSGLPIDETIAGFGFVALCIVFAEILAYTSKIVIRYQKKDQLILGAFIENVLLFFVLIVSFMGSFFTINSGEFSDKLFEDGVSYLDISCSPLDYLYYRVADKLTFISSSETVRYLYLNAFCILIVILLLYFTIRKMMGFVAAFTSAILFVALSFGGMCNMASAILFSATMFFIVLPKWASTNNKLTHKLILLFLLLSGLISGIALFVDISAIGLVIFALVIYYIYKDDSASESSNTGKNILYLFGTIIGYFLGHQIINMMGISLSLTHSFTDIINGNGINVVAMTGDFSPTELIGGNPVILAVVLTLSMVWCIRIFKIERDHGSFVAIVPFVIYVLYALNLLENSVYQSAISYYLAIMGAMGLVSIGKNSLEYIEKERLAKEKAEQEKAARIAEVKKELEEKKNLLSEKEKEKMKLSKKDHDTKNKNNDSIDLSLKTSSDQDIKSLEESLEFLHKKDSTEESENTKEKQENKEEENSSDFDVKQDDKADSKDSNASNASDDSEDSDIQGATKDISDSESVKEHEVVFPEHYASEKPPLKVAPLVKEEPNQKRYVSMSSPASKFARRMDYKTAIVKPGNNESDDTTNVKNDVATIANNISNDNKVENPDKLDENKLTNISKSVIEDSNADAVNSKAVNTEENIIEDNKVVIDSEAHKTEINQIKESDNNINPGSANSVSVNDKPEEIVLDFLKDNTDHTDNENVEPDLMSVNIIESKNSAEQSEDNLANDVHEDEEKEAREPLADNVLDLKSMEKEVEVEEPKPAPKPSPVSATEPVFKSVIAEKPPILGKGAEPVNKIHNPLPTPKKHTNKAAEFDIDPAEVDMHFDIVDLAGKDFFDIN